MCIHDFGILDYASKKVSACLIESKTSIRFSFPKRLFTLVSVFLAFILLSPFSIIPLEFCEAVGTPTYWDSRVYPMGLVDEGDNEAGLKGRATEYLYQSTSEWTTQIADLEDGNFMMQVTPLSLPGIPLPVNVTLTYNHYNAGIDIGVGKGWMTNLHACVSEDAQTHDLTYVTGTGAIIVFEWDSQNSVYINTPGFIGEAEEEVGGGYTITPLGQGSLHFDEDGKLTSITDRCSLNGLGITYDSGKPVSVEDILSGREITLTWNGSGKLTTITDNMSQSWTLTYSQSGDDLVTLTQPGTGAPHTDFGYDGNHRMTSHNDFEGYTYDIAYIASGDHANKLYTLTDSNDHTTTFSYAVNSGGYAKKTTVTDPESRAVDYYFGSTSGSLEKVSEVVDSEEIKKEYAYNALGLLSIFTDSLDNDTTYAYDDVGHLESITYPPPVANGTPFVQQWTYTPSDSLSGKLTSYAEKVTSSVWATTTYAYTDNDAPCKPSNIEDPLEQETTINYNSNGLETSVQTITAGGVGMMYFEYSLDNDLSKMTDFIGNDTVYTFNGNGFLTNLKQYDGSVSTGTLITDKDITRGANNQMTLTEDNVTGLTSEAEYAANGNQTCTTSELGCETCYNTTGTSGETSYINPSAPVADIPEKPLPPGLNPANPSSAGTLPGSLLSPSVSFYSPPPATTTDSQSHTTSYGYDDSMNLLTSTDYLDRDTDYTYDDYGRLSSITLPNGKNTGYTYTDNSAISGVSIEGGASYSYTYNDAGRITGYYDSVQGSFSYTYNVRGNKLSETISSEETEYTYDLLGRLTAISYPDNSSDTFSYSPEGYITSRNGDSYEYDARGNLTEWVRGSDEVDYTYTSPGSDVLGLPNVSTGTNNIGDYSFTYTTQHWLYTLTDTSKTNQSYTYAYSSSKELNELDYPNTLELHQTWSSKMLDLLTVTDASQQTTFLSSDVTYNNNEQMSDYGFSVNAGQNTFSESYDLTYDSLGRLSTMETDSTSRIVTHGYDSGNGNLTSLQFSDLGTYTIDYTNGNIESITYPNSQGEETYTYGGGKGRLSQIEYPNDDTLEFDWNDKDEVTEITYTEYSTQEETQYNMTYTPNHQVATLTQSIDSIQQYVWTFAWGPNGLEKSTKTVNSQTVLTQDFTTDPQGRILSMTYDTIGEGYDGELYFHYDHFGNTTLLTDDEGNPIFSAQYDPCRSKTLQTWNTNNLEIMNLGQGRFSTISLNLYSNITTLVSSTRTITISEDVISAFVARYGTNLVCYFDDYGPQERNPDANPCGSSEGCYISCTMSCRELADIMKDCNKRDVNGFRLLDPDYSSCSEDDYCKLFTKCYNKITDLINNHPLCLEKSWWLHLSCYSLSCWEFHSVGKIYASNAQKDFEDVIKKFCKSA